MNDQLTRNAGLHHVATEHRDWHVMPTVHNARGADLYTANEVHRVENEDGKVSYWLQARGYDRPE